MISERSKSWGPQHVFVPPVHAPDTHEWPIVHGSKSLQKVPSRTGVATHASVLSLHEPVLQSSSKAEQSRAVPVQAPPLQESTAVQYWPSLQGVPLVAGVVVQ